MLKSNKEIEKKIRPGRRRPKSPEDPVSAHPNKRPTFLRKKSGSPEIVKNLEAELIADPREN
jgi:hypothetical protein